MEHKFDIALSFATANEALVENVYHYLRAEGYSVFFAPSPEGQAYISGKNQRQVFYQIFGLEAEYVALFVTWEYLDSEVAMEEATIALTKRRDDGTVIPIYLDHSILPYNLFDPKQSNYYISNNAVDIAVHLAARCRQSESPAPAPSAPQPDAQSSCGMHISGNTSGKQVFIQSMSGDLNL